MSVKQLKSKDLNLLDSYLKSSKETIDFTPYLKYWLPPLLLVFIFGGFYGIVQFQNYQTSNEISDLNKEASALQEKLAKDPNVALYQEWQSTISDAAYYKNLYETIESYPNLKQGTFNTIANNAYGLVQVISLNYARDSQVVTLQIESATASGTEQYVRALKTSDVFADVTYSGYTSSKKDTTSTTDQKSESNATTDAEKILEYLAKQAQTDSKATESTYSVYSATVLCTLK